MRHATHIYRNGVILTMDSRCSIVSSLAVRGETILAVGSDAETSPFRDAETRVVDLGGACSGCRSCAGAFRGGLCGERLRGRRETQCGGEQQCG